MIRLLAAVLCSLALTTLAQEEDNAIEACPGIECMMICPLGFRKDQDGCQICECVEDLCSDVQCPDDRLCQVFTISSGHKVSGCIDVSTPRVCHPPMDPGPCRASLSRYFYNSDSGRCEGFTYGGCKGNDNIFKNQLDCDTICYSGACNTMQCLMECPEGFQVDTLGCDICRCKEVPLPPTPVHTTKPAPIPRKLNPLGCPENTCMMLCEAGFVKDAANCDICQCLDGRVPDNCDANIACAMACDHGFTRDVSGCELCECAPEPRSCDVIQCMMECSDGFLKDAGGCHQCQCVDAAGVAVPISEHKCPDVMCAMYCESGFEKDGNGCDICKCRNPRCPTIHCGTDCQFGLLRDRNECPVCMCRGSPCNSIECDIGKHCEITRQAGRLQPVCVPGEVARTWCSPMHCKMHCEHGWLTNELGCDLCQCRDEQTSACPAQKCMACEYGYRYDQNGCRTCNCLPEPCLDTECLVNQVCESRKVQGCYTCPQQAKCLNYKDIQRMKVVMMFEHEPAPRLDKKALMTEIRSRMETLLQINKEYIRGIRVKSPNDFTTYVSFHVVTYGNGDLFEAFEALKAKVLNPQEDSGFPFEGKVFVPERDSLAVVYSSEAEYEEEGEELPIEGEQHWLTANTVYVACGGAALLAIVVVIALIVYCCLRRSKLQKKQGSKRPIYVQAPTQEKTPYV